VTASGVVRDFQGSDCTPAAPIGFAPPPYPGDVTDTRPGRSASETWLRIGVVMVALGTLASIATLLPLALGEDALPVAVYLLCFLAPLGLGVVLVALWRRASTRSRRLTADHPAAE
jgi:hypothetical protein